MSAASANAAFDRAFQEVIGHEGGYTTKRSDRGNWTSGKVGVGQLKGTKYGISAMAYPSLDIANLTLADAKIIYQRDYWNACRCDLLPPLAAVLVFDAAVNHGNSRSIKMLQEALGVVADGKIGPITRAAAHAADTAPLVMNLISIRLLFWTDISTWGDFGKGWTRRGARLLAMAAKEIKKGV